jgi:N-dimethylarginine dimethylaminohydrolase
MEEEKARKKAAQAAAHKRWRDSEKGKAYYQKQKLKKNGVDVVEIKDGEVVATYGGYSSGSLKDL